MGLTASSTGSGALDCGLNIKKNSGEKVIALAGNPNVGKSTVFNALTGMHQHTGNWPGKTVSNAQGTFSVSGQDYILVDIPGAYSLLALSAEEEVARDFIAFGEADAVTVVCDASCLERNLNLALQIMEITPHVAVCVNLLDEAEKKGISVDFEELELRLGVPVTGTSARNGVGLDDLRSIMAKAIKSDITPRRILYPEILENAVSKLSSVLTPLLDGKLNSRWTALKLLENDAKLISSMENYLGSSFSDMPEFITALTEAKAEINELCSGGDSLRDILVSSAYKTAEIMCRGVITYSKPDYNSRQLKIDRLLTKKSTGIPVMLLMLAVIFFLTIKGANYPSALLSELLFRLQDFLLEKSILLGIHEYIYEPLILGAFRTLAWVVSVMLPPMAIFFPLFTILEDLGYLPRVAFNLDSTFRKCGACGKQALTMCMGLGCNAAGVTGCRIIDSPRERLIAILTNSFVPCNGRFPILLSVITMFFIASGSVLQALLLTVFILAGILMTFLASRFLSVTLLKGLPSSLTLEMPPYRRPQFGKVIVRSVFDRTLFVLGRAIAAAAPAGLLIWILANVTIGESTILSICTGFLDPIGKFMGLDGVILMAFILGLPANEIVFPIIVMAYTASGVLSDTGSLSFLCTLLTENGWTWLTALNTMIFTLMHWPCSTTLMTVKKETGSLKWTAVSFLLPTAAGFILCTLFSLTAHLLHLV